MRVLVADGSAHDRDLAARHLQSAGCEVLLASDASAALACVEQQRPDVIVLDSTLPGLSPFLLIARLRQGDATALRYVILVTGRPSTTELTAAYAAGVDDYLRKPLVREEFLARVAAHDRIMRWATRAFRLGQASPEAARIARLRSWQQIAATVAADFGGMLDATLGPVACDAPLSGAALAAAIPLTLAAEQVEVRLRVGFDAATLRRVAEALLGDPAAPEEALRDIVRELANTAAGAFKRASLVEGVTLTCGLPVDLPAGGPAAEPGSICQRFTLADASGQLRLGFEGEIAARSLRRVSIAELREGMVLARDLKNEAGGLLVPAGTRLTSSQVVRLSKMLAASRTLDVADAA